MSSAPSWLAGGIGGAVVQTDGWIGGNGGVVQTGCTVGSIDILVGSVAVAKEVVRSRNSISMHLGEIVATTRTVGHLSKSTEVMKLVNNLMKAPEVAATMGSLGVLAS